MRVRFLHALARVRNQGRLVLAGQRNGRRRAPRCAPARRGAARHQQNKPECRLLALFAAAARRYAYATSVESFCRVVSTSFSTSICSGRSAKSSAT